MACGRLDPLLQDVHGIPDADFSAHWSYCMNLFRWTLHPKDVVAAIAAKAWEPDSTFASDKGKFMAMRGMFDGGNDDDDMDWYSLHERRNCIDVLGVDEPPTSIQQESRSWWDHYRMQRGSPFHYSY